MQENPILMQKAGRLLKVLLKVVTSSTQLRSVKGKLAISVRYLVVTYSVADYLFNGNSSYTVI